jgi:hypothetical protein
MNPSNQPNQYNTVDPEARKGVADHSIVPQSERADLVGKNYNSLERNRSH